jgi:thioesterase domain-containing protein
LADYIRHQAESPASLLVTIRAGGSRPPLFLGHGIGGSLLTFRELIAELDEDQPVYGLRIPASLEEIDGPDPVPQAAKPDLIRRLAAVYVQHIRAAVPQGPYQLAGHSSAGLVVVEVAQQLRAMGSEVHLLALLDADIGQGTPRELPWKSWSALRIFFRRNVEELAHCYRFGMRELTMRKVNHYKRKFQVLLVRHLPRVSRPFPEAFITEAHFALALHAFRPDPYLGEVWNYVAQDEPRSHQDPSLGWRSQVSGLLQTVTLPGGHRTMFVQPYVNALAVHLESRLHPEVGNFPQVVVPTPPIHAVREQAGLFATVAELQSLGVEI